MNMDMIFYVFNYANIPIIFPNFYTIFGEAVGVVTYSEEDKF